MVPELITKRLILRQLSVDDAEDVFEYASNPDVSRYVYWDAHDSIEVTIEYLRSVENKYKNNELLDWGIFYKEENMIIGSCGFPRIDKINKCAELGYVLSPRFWNRGIATEAAGKLVQYAFENLDIVRIESICAIENIASEKVMQKTGMSFEGVLRKKLCSAGTHYDVKIYSKIV